MRWLATGHLAVQFLAFGQTRNTKILPGRTRTQLRLHPNPNFAPLKPPTGPMCNAPDCRQIRGGAAAVAGDRLRRHLQRQLHTTSSRAV